VRNALATKAALTHVVDTWVRLTKWRSGGGRGSGGGGSSGGSGSICEGGRPTVVFAIDVAHSQAVSTAFEAAGVPAAHVDGAMPATQRERVFADVRAGRIRVLSSVSVISEGFDAPSISCVVLLRPTHSRGLYVQQVGRGLRSFGAGGAAKRDCLVLDFAESTMRHGPVTRPIESVLDSPRDGASDASAQAVAAGVKAHSAGRAWECADAACAAMMHPACAICALCGAPRELTAPPRGKARAAASVGAGVGAKASAGKYAKAIVGAAAAAPSLAVPRILSPPRVLVIPRFRAPDGGDKGEGGLGALTAALSGLRLAGAGAAVAPPPLRPAPMVQRLPSPPLPLPREGAV
jgi:hypothetical protein